MAQEKLKMRLWYSGALYIFAQNKWKCVFICLNTTQECYLACCPGKQLSVTTNGN
jgi:hypothetical protein